VHVPERLGFAGGDRMVELLVASNGCQCARSAIRERLRGREDDVEHRAVVKRAQAAGSRAATRWPNLGGAETSFRNTAGMRPSPAVNLPCAGTAPLRTSGCVAKHSSGVGIGHASSVAKGVVRQAAEPTNAFVGGCRV
jgi:hypothetical protein